MAETRHEILICNCEKTMALDGAAIGTALGREPLRVNSHLCRAEIGVFEKAIAGGTPVCVACTQEAPLFAEIAGEAGQELPIFVNIRENAGWTAEKRTPTAKIASLLARAMKAVKPTRSLSLVSDGLCLVTGSGQAAFDAAALLNRRLSVTLLLTGSDDILLPSTFDFPIFSGRVRNASGALGAFDVVVDGYAPLLPSSREKLEFAMPRDGAKTKCSVIVDLTGGQPLFGRPEGLDGYFVADPNNPAALMRALFEASDYQGEFEKPLYVQYDADICAHSRSQITGCSKCIDNCPPGAIKPDGDNVLVDHKICGGCGICAAHCPTGAVSYQYPPSNELISGIQALAAVYQQAGGKNAVLLLHDGGHGAGIIGAMARMGRGLPANVVPVEMHSVSRAGHDVIAAALVAGFCRVLVLADPRHISELSALEAEIALVEAILSGYGHEQERVRLVLEHDPDTVETILWGLKPIGEIARVQVAALGGKREVAMAMFREIAAKASEEIIALPASAPYGKINVDTVGCTLCLSCVSACPADALRDNPDKPQLRFVETACVQCGICAATCPEKVITLEPRLNLSAAAMQPVTLYEEEPFECVRCGKPFASRSTIERITEKLGGKHRMFESAERISLISMCDNCRLETLAEGGRDPFAIAERPRVRTTDDYLEAGKKGLSVEDFLSKS